MSTEEVEFLQAKNKQDVKDYNRLYDGYSALVNAYVDTLSEVSLLRGENIRWPLDLPEAVVIDLADTLIDRVEPS